MRGLGDVARRVLLLLGVWVVLGRLVGLVARGTPDATIASAVATTALWFATAGVLALRDGRRGLAAPYPRWAAAGLVAAASCVAWQWVSASVTSGVVDVVLLRDDLVALSPGLMVGAWTCAGLGLGLGRHDAAVRRAASARASATSDRAGHAARRPKAQRPLTVSATRAIQEVLPPLRSSRRSAAR